MNVVLLAGAEHVNWKFLVKIYTKVSVVKFNQKPNWLVDVLILPEQQSVLSPSSKASFKINTN